MASGTLESKRTAIPFLYNLEKDIPGLDVIDFPGADDQDDDIQENVEFVLYLTQLSIFVVDYRYALFAQSQNFQ